MNKKYQVIYADPPWKFGSKQLQKYNGERFESLEKREYPTMTVNNICALPVKEITCEDCALFLWTTDAHIPEALEVIKAWGFKYITVAFIWSKKTSTGKQIATLGAWTMKNCELCLLATKGRMLRFKTANNIYQLVEAERTTHSTKPEEVRIRIEQLFNLPLRIELFARKKFLGWDSWGNEVENDISLAHDKEIEG